MPSFFILLHYITDFRRKRYGLSRDFFRPVANVMLSPSAEGGMYLVVGIPPYSGIPRRCAPQNDNQTIELSILQEVGLPRPSKADSQW